MITNNTVSALLLSFVISGASVSAYAGQDKGDHYMMSGGNAHQGHMMNGNTHSKNSVVKHDEMALKAGHIKKVGADYVMHGGDGNQGHWEGRELKTSVNSGYKMQGGDF